MQWPPVRSAIAAMDAAADRAIAAVATFQAAARAAAIRHALNFVGGRATVVQRAWRAHRAREAGAHL